MSHSHSTNRRGHETALLIPWYVNGTIAERDRQRVDAHLRTCAACRAALSQEQRIHRGMANQDVVEYMPAASVKRLHERLDQLESGSGPGSRSEAESQAGAESQGESESESAPVGAPEVEYPRRFVASRILMAASVAAVAVSLGLFLARDWMPFSRGAAPAVYHTVTGAAPRAPGEVIRAVFAPTITLVELQAILDDAKLRIVSGPTEAGVYSLASNSTRPVRVSLALLRQHAPVQFAESTTTTQAAPELSDAP